MKVIFPLNVRMLKANNKNPYNTFIIELPYAQVLFSLSISIYLI